MVVLKYQTRYFIIKCASWGPS